MNYRLCWLFSGWVLLLAASRSQGQAPEDSPGREVLREAVEQHERQITEQAEAGANQSLRSHPAFVEMERRFLAGEVSARQFQKFLRDLRVAPVDLLTNAPAAAVPTNAVAPAAAAATAPAPPVPAPTTNSAAKVAPTNAVALAVTNGAPAPEARPSGVEGELSLEELEARMNALLRKKTEREIAVETNAMPIDLTAPGSSMSKRERLDALLRYYIEGRISEADYEGQRAKIVAEPE